MQSVITPTGLVARPAMGPVDEEAQVPGRVRVAAHDGSRSTSSPQLNVGPRTRLRRPADRLAIDEASSPGGARQLASDVYTGRVKARATGRVLGLLQLWLVRRSLCMGSGDR